MTSAISLAPLHKWNKNKRHLGLKRRFLCICFCIWCGNLLWYFLNFEMQQPYSWKTTRNCSLSDSAVIVSKYRKRCHFMECDVLNVNKCTNVCQLIVIILWPVSRISNSALLNLYRSAEKTCICDSNTQCREFNLLEVLCTKVILMSLSNLFEFSSIAIFFSLLLLLLSRKMMS